MRGNSHSEAARWAALAVAALACALLVLAADGLAAPARAGVNSATFPDSTGEDTAGPDITSVAVANDDRGGLTFTVPVPNRPTLTADMIFLLLLDTDANPNSGSADFLGADYIVELDGPLTGPAGAGLFRWNGSDYTATGVPQTTLTFSYANGATLRINASELGGTRKISFGVIAVSGIVLGSDGEPDFTNTHFDNAPDAGHGFFSYDVKITPATLAVRSSGSQPLRPRAGQRYTSFAVFRRSDGAALQGGTVTCRATVAGRALRPTASRLVGGRASCTFAIPKAAKGKMIRVTVGVTSQGLKAAHSIAARIL